MHPRALAVALLACTLGATAHARADQVAGDERIDYTAYTLRSLETTLGPSKLQFGLLDEIMIGTYVPTWFAFPWLGEPIPTGFIKLRDPFAGPVAVSLRATVAYLGATTLASELSGDNKVNAGLLVVPVEAAVSYRFEEHFWQSAELMYVVSGADGSSETATAVRGTAAASNVTLSTLSELRLTRVLSLTLLTRLLVYQSGARVKAQIKRDGTEVDAELGIESRQKFYACVVPGVELSFGNINLDVGLGYGSLWLPVIQLPVPGYGLVPEANFYVRF